MITKTHYFYHFMVSPWPLIVSLNLMSMFISMSLLFKYNSFLNLMLSLFLISLTSMYWWYSYSGEINLEGMDSINLENSIKFAMLLFISSEIFFFFSFFWSYFHFFLSPILDISLSWPPVYLSMFNFYDTPFLNTLILLSSGITITISHHYSNKENFHLSMKYLFITFFLGVLFSGFQLQEYCNSFFSINDSIFGSNFFMLTGFHGLHVMIGTTFLLIILYRENIFNSSKTNMTGFEISAWYWHFVDVVWIFLYFLIYYMNNI